ncbi:unnamed protein product [Schistosoma turkestanicum]|nr:unnamed protein product [Schistosoma turkestanicum]
MISHWLHDHGALDDDNRLPIEKSNILLIAENHQSVRNVIHAEAAYRNLDNELMHQLPWLVYVNLLECCQQFLHNSNNSNDENPMDQKEEIIENQAKKECQFNSIHEAACAV